MALVSLRTMALALPLSLGLACSHARSSQARTEPTEHGTAAASNQQDIQPDTRRSTGHASDQTVAGRVIRASSDSVTIDAGQGQERTLEIVPQTLVTLDGQSAMPGDIQQGQDVRASYSTQDGRDVAVQIEATRATDKG